MVDESSEPEFLSVRETARLLGVHENTIRNWAREGVIVSSRVSGTSAHRFAKSEVERLVASRGQMASSVTPTRRIVLSELATAADLDAWSATESAKGEFPELMRRLLAATPGVTNLDIRTHEGTAAAGWDGRASSSGSSFVPPGTLRFEFGTNANIKAKAQADFEKRRSEHGVSSTTFVYATPRNWPSAAAWADERRSEGVFADVQAWDAHKLEGWLQATPSVHYWISERLALRPHGVMTLDQWWDSFSGRLRIDLPPSMFVAGRAHEAGLLMASLTRNDSPAEAVLIKASTEDDALAFVRGAIADESIRSQTLIVLDSSTWHRLGDSSQRLILIPTFDGPDLNRASQGGHRIVLLADTGTAVQDQSAILLNKIDRVLGTAALQEAVASNEPLSQPLDAEAMVALARRSLPAFVRALAIDPRLETPPWASDPAQVGVLAPLMLASQWGNSARDHSALESLTSHAWPEIERRLKSLESTGDSPFVRSGGTWRIASPTECALLLAPHLIDADIQNWADVVTSVLLEPDPYAGKGQTERLMASAIGAVETYSESLRSGIAESLALVGSLRAQLPDPGLGVQVDLIVRGLLGAANSDSTGATWARLSGVLPDLAEASPDEFLAGLDTAMSGATPLIATMFQDSADSDFFGSSSPHPNFIWALERLSYSEEYFGRAADAMRRLVRIDPGGKLSNRPLEAIGALLAPWIANTAGTLDDKFAAVERALQQDADTGWLIALSVWPDNKAFVMSPHRPKFRDWTPRERSVSLRDWQKFVHRLVPLVLEAAGESVERWIALLPKIDEVPPTEREASLARLNDVISVAPWTDDQRFRLWERLKEIVDRHTEFPDADWSLAAEELAQFHSLAKQLEPTNDPRRFVSRFDWRITIPGLRFDDPAYKHEVERLQLEAIAILAAEGTKSLEALAREAKAPHLVGRYLAEITDSLDGTVLMWLASDDENLQQVASTLATRRALERGPEWVSTTLTAHSNDAEVIEGLARALPWQPAFWNLISNQEPALEGPYWNRSIHPVNVEEALHDEVIQRLLDHGAVWGALDFAHNRLYAKNPASAQLLKEILVRLGSHNEPPPNRLDAGQALQYALEVLEEQTPNDPDLPRLEFAWFSFLRDRKPSRALFRLLNSKPEEFVELVKMVTRADGEPRRERTPSEQSAGRIAFDILRHWEGIPGLDEHGSIDPSQLDEWVRRARSEFAASGRESVGDEMVGEVLSCSPVGSDGVWPAEPVRDVIEMAGNARLETGLLIGKSNKRGFTSRGVFEGGDQERAMAVGYRKMATALRTKWPRTARLLSRMADDLERDARWHDAGAERLADGS